MTYAEELAQHRRLSILKVLVDVDGCANESILKDALERYGLRTGLTRTAVREDLRFLEKTGCVVLSWPAETLAVANITERGVEVAEGLTRVEGIKKPSIGV